jgi:hypothetical protein
MIKLKEITTNTEYNKTHTTTSHLNLDQLLTKKYENGNYYGVPSVLIGLRLSLKGDQTLKPTKYMEDYFYGEAENSVASSGQFKYLPIQAEHQSDQFFVDAENNKIPGLLKEIYKARVKLIDGNTQVEIMVNCEILESLDDELSAMYSDLNEFVEKGFALSWSQINLNSH